MNSFTTQVLLSFPSIDYPVPARSELLGMLLEESGLVSSSQIKLALRDRLVYPHLSFGEILVLRGWVKPKTVIFFNQYWQQELKQREKKRLGEYLLQAALLNSENVRGILQEQRKTGTRFGEIAIKQGLIRPMTVDFFLNYLHPERSDTSFKIEQGAEEIDQFTKLTVNSEAYLLDATYKQFFTYQQ